MRGLPFQSAADVFSGSGSVGYLLKAMGKQTYSSDFLHFPSVLAQAYVANSSVQIIGDDLAVILKEDKAAPDFIARTFSGIFFSPEDLRFLDLASWNVRKLPAIEKRSLVLSALIRSCMKRQPRGVFTVAGDPDHYKDARRDLKLSIREHFLEQTAVCNAPNPAALAMSWSVTLRPTAG